MLYECKNIASIGETNGHRPRTHVPLKSSIRAASSGLSIVFTSRGPRRARIRTLEEELKRQLFIRNCNGAQPTLSQENRG
jgi:hypothetical protein